MGRQHQDLQVGRLISFAATCCLCLFWTIPVSLVSGLGTLEAMRGIAFINNLLDVLPGLAPLFEVVAPQFLVLLNSLLPMILRCISAFEGPVSGAEIEASLFEKLAAFVIIQVSESVHTYILTHFL